MGAGGKKHPLLVNHCMIPSGLTVKIVLSGRLLMINSKGSPDLGKHSYTFP